MRFTNWIAADGNRPKHTATSPGGREDVYGLIARMKPCACGRIELDGQDVSRAGLTSVAVSPGLPYARALLLASLDYAHRSGGCPQQVTVLHELVSAPRPDNEPAELSALLERLRLVGG